MAAALLSLELAAAIAGSAGFAISVPELEKMSLAISAHEKVVAGIVFPDFSATDDSAWLPAISSSQQFV
jgi:hypothetical protein